MFHFHPPLRSRLRLTSPNPQLVFHFRVPNIRRTLNQLATKEACGSGVRGDHVDATSRLVEEVAEDDLPRRTGYEWAISHVTCHFSKYLWSSMVESYAVTCCIFADDVLEGALTVEWCSTVDNVCHRREDHGADFFFMCAYLFTNSHVRVPFDEFTMGVLQTLNVAPTQLQPNSWASLRAFRVLA